MTNALHTCFADVLSVEKGEDMFPYIGVTDVPNAHAAELLAAVFQNVAAEFGVINRPDVFEI